MPIWKGNLIKHEELQDINILTAHLTSSPVSSPFTIQNSIYASDTDQYA